MGCMLYMLFILFILFMLFMGCIFMGCILCMGFILFMLLMGWLYMSGIARGPGLGEVRPLEVTITTESKGFCAPVFSLWGVEERAALVGVVERLFSFTGAGLTGDFTTLGVFSLGLDPGLSSRIAFLGV